MLMEATIICLTLNAYHEARGQPSVGQEAVTHVVLNRVEHGQFPNMICDVVHQGGERRDRCQFSWYCDGKSDIPLDEDAWTEVFASVQRVLDGSEDPTHGALYYHNLDVRPSWASIFRMTVTIADHIFYVEE